MAYFVNGYVRNVVYEQKFGRTRKAEFGVAARVNGPDWSFQEKNYNKELLVLYRQQGFPQRNVTFVKAAESGPIRTAAEKVGVFAPRFVKIYVHDPTVTKHHWKHAKRHARLRVRVDPSDPHAYDRLVHTIATHTRVKHMVPEGHTPVLAKGDRVFNSETIDGEMMRAPGEEFAVRFVPGRVPAHLPAYRQRMLTGEDMEEIYKPYYSLKGKRAGLAANPLAGKPIAERAVQLVCAELTDATARHTQSLPRSKAVERAAELIADPMQVSYAVEKVLKSPAMYIGEEHTDPKEFWKHRKVNLGELTNEISSRVHERISESVDTDGFFRLRPKAAPAHIGTEMGGSAPEAANGASSGLFVKKIAQAAFERETIACGLSEFFGRLTGAYYDGRYDNGGPDLGPCPSLGLHASAGRCGGLSAHLDVPIPHIHRHVRNPFHRRHHHHHHVDEEKNVVEQTVIVDLGNHRRAHKKGGRRHKETVVVVDGGGASAKLAKAPEAATEEDLDKEEEALLMSRTVRRNKGLNSHSRHSDEETPAVLQCESLPDSDYSIFLSKVRAYGAKEACVYLALHNRLFTEKNLSAIGSKWAEFLAHYCVPCPAEVVSIVDRHFCGTSSGLAVLKNQKQRAFRVNIDQRFKVLNAKTELYLDSPDFCVAPGFGVGIRFLPFPSFHTVLNF